MHCGGLISMVVELFGIKVERVWDVGVAGIHRSLLAQAHCARGVLPCIHG